MIEGNQEYNDQIIKRLHKVLRPFILRRLKKDVEKQMPKKYEHVIKCKLSKRQRLLYDEFMSLGSTRDTLAEGRYMSVINILMQLRKVCNHPDLFDPRPILSPFVAEPIEYKVPSVVFNIREDVLNERVRDLFHYQPSIADMEIMYSAFACHRSKRLQTPKKLIEELLTKQISCLETSPTDFDSCTATSIEQDRFFLNSTLEGMDPDIVAKIRFRLGKILVQNRINIDLNNLKAKHIQNLIHYLQRLNKQKCSFFKPVYGRDLQECIGRNEIFLKSVKLTRSSLDYCASSFSNCLQTLNYETEKHRMSVFWSQTEALANLLNLTFKQLFDSKSNWEMMQIMARFIVYVPHVWYATTSLKSSSHDPFDSETIRLRLTGEPNSSYYTRQKTLIEDITHVARQDTFTSQLLELNSVVDTSMLAQFPETRLIQYDCGKLQSLSRLLRDLYVGSHRVLIFTQMTKMLDVLEKFLNYHGYKYLRLDGTTSIDRRQVLMDRFNNDKRIFVFILSTRSGGIGVNLTGADTVVFYDSDWNPTMDAQAQDRCHRIGQTRDVNIYRLISERTVEENILKKANQKRLLADMTIEGGCFTTALLKKHHITELFECEENNSTPHATNNLEVIKERGEEVVETAAISNEAPLSPGTAQVNITREAEANFEEALALVEDETDVQAAKELIQEVRADIEEFDENNTGADMNENTNSIVEDGAGPFRTLDQRLESEFKSIETEVRIIILIFCFKIIEQNLIE